jgi:hypothetical protein
MFRRPLLRPSSPDNFWQVIFELGFFAQCILRKILLDDPELHIA